MTGESSLKTFVLDQLHAVGVVSARGMFGGFGLYRGDVFFGIIFKGRVYFKTNDTTRAAYVRRGMKPFRPNAKQTLASYYEVPPEVIEDSEQMTEWAQQAIAAGRLRRTSETRR